MGSAGVCERSVFGHLVAVISVKGGDMSMSNPICNGEAVHDGLRQYAVKRA